MTIDILSILIPAFKEGIKNAIINFIWILSRIWPALLILLIFFLGYLFCRYMYRWWKKVST